MTLYDLFVPGDPKGQPRPRAFAVGGKARVYDPGTAEHWKSQIALAFPRTIVKYSGPVSVALSFYMARPKNHYRKDGALKDDTPIAYAKKPDADNLAKACLDAMTTMGVWDDDAQVAVLSIHKWYVSPIAFARAGCQIVVKTLL
jgi:crossover junction endodeoxyribonuclease RusA